MSARVRDRAGRIARKAAYVAEHWPADGVPPEAVERALSALVPTGVAFLDLCIWKGRFPSRKAQFCTEELKTTVLQNYQLHLVERGYCVWSWQGIRADESITRRHRAPFEALDVCGVEVNPLYRHGMKRVGCMLCINASKTEIAEVSRRWPEVIDKIRRWESAVAAAAKRGAASFFPAPNDGRADQQGRNIDERVAWSRTLRGGVARDLLADLPPPACSSHYQLCE